MSDLPQTFEEFIARGRADSYGVCNKSGCRERTGGGVQIRAYAYEPDEQGRAKQRQRNMVGFSGTYCERHVVELATLLGETARDATVTPDPSKKDGAA